MLREKIATIIHENAAQPYTGANTILTLFKEYLGKVELPENPYRTDVHLAAGVYDGLYRRKYTEGEQATLSAIIASLEGE